MDSDHNRNASMPPDEVPVRKRRGRPPKSALKSSATASNKKKTQLAPKSASGAESVNRQKTGKMNKDAKLEETMNKNDNDNSESDVVDEKKSRLRARNREAAQKCRVRKQKGVDNLQAQEASVEAIHEALMAEANMLRGEVLMLKNMVLQHGACQCSYIDNYIHESAHNLAAQASPTVASSSPGTGHRGNSLPSLTTQDSRSSDEQSSFPVVSSGTQSNDPALFGIGPTPTQPTNPSTSPTQHVDTSFSPNFLFAPNTDNTATDLLQQQGNVPTVSNAPADGWKHPFSNTIDPNMTGCV